MQLIETETVLSVQERVLTQKSNTSLQEAAPTTS